MPRLGREALAGEFARYQLQLSPAQLDQVDAYLELLLRWNRRINLTALREPVRIVRELFCESIYLTRVVQLAGRLLDIGSGAGFPGLALRIAVPGLQVVLLDASQRKCAFLKEVVRVLQMSDVEVVCSRVETIEGVTQGGFRLVTTRAVAIEKDVLLTIARVIEWQGMLAVFTSRRLCKQIVSTGSGFDWNRPVAIPETKQRVLLIGKRMTL